MTGVASHGCFLHKGEGGAEPEGLGVGPHCHHFT